MAAILEVWEYLNVFHARQNEETDTQRQETSMLDAFSSAMYCSQLQKKPKGNQQPRGKKYVC